PGNAPSSGARLVTISSAGNATARARSAIRVRLSGSRSWRSSTTSVPGPPPSTDRTVSWAIRSSAPGAGALPGAGRAGAPGTWDRGQGRGTGDVGLRRGQPVVRRRRPGAGGAGQQDGGSRAQDTERLGDQPALTGASFARDHHDPRPLTWVGGDAGPRLADR